MSKRLRLAEALAKLDGIKLNSRELVDQWLLITYDLPVTPEGNKVRFKFLKQVARMGGIMQSKSCYLLPWTDDAEVAALAVAKAGNAYVWTSTAADPEISTKVTNFYDENLKKQIENIRERLSRIEFHKENDELRMAKMMVRKTIIFFNDLLYAAFSRGSKDIFEEVKQLHKDIETTMEDLQ